MLQKNITVLDVGFGLGFPLLEAAMRLGSSCKVYGIDPWEKGIERTKLKIHNYGITNVELLNAEAENIPLPGNSIDLIICNNGLNNVNDINRTLHELSRVAKHNAQFVFTFNTNKTMSEFYSVFENVLKENNLADEIEKMKQHINEKRKPVVEILNLLTENHFIVNEVSYDEFHYTFVDGTTMLNHFLIRLAFIDSWKKIVSPEIQEQIFQLVEKKLNSFSDRQGKLKLSIPFVLIDAVRN